MSSERQNQTDGLWLAVASATSLLLLTLWWSQSPTAAASGGASEGASESTREPDCGGVVRSEPSPGPWAGPLDADGCLQVLHSDDKPMHKAALLRLSVLHEERLSHTWCRLAARVSDADDPPLRRLAGNLVSLAAFVQSQSGQSLLLVSSAEPAAAEGPLIDVSLDPALRLATTLVLQSDPHRWSPHLAAVPIATRVTALAWLPVKQLNAARQRAFADAVLQTARQHRDRRLLHLLAAVPVSAVPPACRGEVVSRMVAELSGRSLRQRAEPPDQQLAAACLRLVVDMDAVRRRRLVARLKQLGFGLPAAAPR